MPSRVSARQPATDTLTNVPLCFPIGPIDRAHLNESAAAKLERRGGEFWQFRGPYRVKSVGYR